MRCVLCYPGLGLQPYLAPGALLAIPRSSADSVTTTTVPGALIKQGEHGRNSTNQPPLSAVTHSLTIWLTVHLHVAMIEYGAYIVDDTASDSAALIFEEDLSDDFPALYNLTLSTSGGPWYNDLLEIFQGLQVVTNNHNSSVGGGGAPGVPLAPPICAEHGDDSATGEEYPACAVWRQGAQVHVKTDDILHFAVDLGNKAASELRLRTFV
jgi:hypothetical protein